MGSLEIRPAIFQKNPTIHQLEIRHDADAKSDVSYVWDEDKHMWYFTIMIDEAYQGQGLGCQLIRQFIQTVGHQQKIYGEIIHDESIAFIREHKYHLLAQNKRLFLEPKIANTVPLVIFMQKSGLAITSVALEYYPPGHRLESYSQDELTALPPRRRKGMEKYEYISLMFQGKT